jgi:hypothetical protein
VCTVKKGKPVLIANKSKKKKRGQVRLRLHILLHRILQTYLLRFSPSYRAVVDKLKRYLLSPSHPVVGSKAIWFKKALGFTKNNLHKLARQIKFDPSEAIVKDVTKHGTIYNQIINITGANSKKIDVLFSFIKRQGEKFARLVTAIPSDKK